MGLMRFGEWKKYRNVGKRLKQYDKKTGLSRRAKSMADDRGFPTLEKYDDFGRSLKDYNKIHHLLEKHGGDLKGKKLLHLASSHGVYTRFLQDHGIDAIAFDLGKSASKIAKSIGNKNVVLGNAKRRVLGSERIKGGLPFKSDSLDYVISDHFLLSSYPNLEGKGARWSMNKEPVVSKKVLKDLHRALKPGGIAVLSRCTLGNKISGKTIEELKEMGFDILEVDSPYRLFSNPYTTIVSDIVIKKK